MLAVLLGIYGKARYQYDDVVSVKDIHVPVSVTDDGFETLRYH
jgi:hypothetical protein